MAPKLASGLRNSRQSSAALLGAIALAGVLVLASAGAAPALPLPVPAGVFGSVSSVNGSSTAGTCGIAAAPGTLTLTNARGTTNVAVAATTKFVVARVASPSFANVCVGELVAVIGTVSGTTLNARQVIVAPAAPKVALGIVASVNGSTTPGTCGTAGSPGTFTLTTRAGSQPVVVSAVTRFAGVTPSFAGVCVNGVVVAVGPVSGGAINAIQVAITSRSAPISGHPAGAFGLVSSVNGSATPGTCGVAGSPGTLTLTNARGTRDVAVTATTKFVAAHVASPSFANVCVGESAGAVGTLSGTTLNARQVVVAPVPPKTALGIVASVNGSTTPGTCGVAASPGTFTLTTRTGSQAVAVSATTRFAGAQPSFAGVCVNGVVVAVGPASAGTINATLVIVTSRGI